MFSGRRAVAGALLGVLCCMLTSCFDSQAPNEHWEINLYSGIRGLANIGDSWQQVSQLCKHDTQPLELPSGSDENTIKFQAAYAIPALGTRLYIRENRVALIEIQEPFRGAIQGKTINLFEFKPPPGKSWDDVLILHFGPPTARASGGRLGSDASFYSWGDISYNHMGINEIAIYRDPSISSFRQRHFGRDIGSVFSH